VGWRSTPFFGLVRHTIVRRSGSGKGIGCTSTVCATDPTAGRRADAQRERAHGGERVARAAEQHARGVS
jgi:hypothetical protein